MKLSPHHVLEHARSDEGRKQLRYVGVSLVFVPVGQIMIQVLPYLFHFSYTASSLVTSAILTLPNFFANKIFVWRVTSRDNLRTQVLVFWVAAMLGVSFATGLTYGVERATSNQSAVIVKFSVFIAQLVGFGTVWLIRFVVLDKWLFKVTHSGAEPSPDAIDEMHRDFPV